MSYIKFRIILQKRHLLRDGQLLLLLVWIVFCDIVDFTRYDTSAMTSQPCCVHRIRMLRHCNRDATNDNEESNGVANSCLETYLEQLTQQMTRVQCPEPRSDIITILGYENMTNLIIWLEPCKLEKSTLRSGKLWPASIGLVVAEQPWFGFTRADLVEKSFQTKKTWVY